MIRKFEVLNTIYDTYTAVYQVLRTPNHTVKFIQAVGCTLSEAGQLENLDSVRLYSFLAKLTPKGSDCRLHNLLRICVYVVYTAIGLHLGLE